GRAPPAPPPLPPLPLPERTRRALDALEAEHLPERGMQREFHFQLSGIARGYLGERFGFDALECTSGELVREVERRARPRGAGRGGAPWRGRGRRPRSGGAGGGGGARGGGVGRPRPRPRPPPPRRPPAGNLPASCPASAGRACGVSGYYWKSPEAFWLLALV